MAIAATLQDYLETHHASFDVLDHTYAPTSRRCADAADVAAHRMAKGVVLGDEQGFLMAVLPADKHLQLSAVRKQLGRMVGLATEQDLATLFTDCSLGAIPPCGEAYGMQTIVDDELAEEPDVYFEAGDHQQLVHMRTADFMRLMQNAQHGHFVSALS